MTASILHMYWIGLSLYLANVNMLHFNYLFLQRGHWHLTKDAVMPLPICHKSIYSAFFNLHKLLGQLKPYLINAGLIHWVRHYKHFCMIHKLPHTSCDLGMEWMNDTVSRHLLSQHHSEDIQVEPRHR